MIRGKLFGVGVVWGICCGACGGGQDLTAEQLSGVVEAGKPALEACYQRALDRSPKKEEVRLEVVIKVEPSGQVVDVTLGKGAGPELSDCIRSAISGMQFPKAEASTHASLPLIFRPEEG